MAEEREGRGRIKRREERRRKQAGGERERSRNVTNESVQTIDAFVCFQWLSLLPLVFSLFSLFCIV